MMWEMKSPRGSSKCLMRDTLVRTVRQSSHIVVDLCRTKLHDRKCLRDLAKHSERNAITERIKVIIKRDAVIDINSLRMG